MIGSPCPSMSFKNDSWSLTNVHSVELYLSVNTRMGVLGEANCGVELKGFSGSHCQEHMGQLGLRRSALPAEEHRWM